MPVSSVFRSYFVLLTPISSVNPVVVQLPAPLRQLNPVVRIQQLHRLVTPLLPMPLHPPPALLLLPNPSNLA